MTILLRKLLKELAAAEYLGVSVACLRKWRRNSLGPNWVRVGGPEGRAIRYRIDDLEAYVSENTVIPTPSQEGR